MALPFVWMLLTSVKPLAEVGTESWLPTHWQWHNYTDVFDATNPDPNRRGSRSPGFM